MSQLILTDEEQAMSIMDAPDKPLADAVRFAYSVMHTVSDKLNKPVLMVAAQHVCVFTAAETNAARMVTTIHDLSSKGQPLGSWRVTIEKLDENGNPVETA